MLLKFTLKHKYCGMEKTVIAYNVYEAFRRNNLDLHIWKAIKVEVV